MNQSTIASGDAAAPWLSVVIPVKAIGQPEADALARAACRNPMVEFVVVGPLNALIMNTLPNLRLVEQEVDLYSAMNIGLISCTGRHVLFMGVDDELLEENVQLVLEELRSIDATLLVALPVMVGSRLVGNRPSRHGPSALHHQGVLFPREETYANGGYSDEWRLHSDLDLMVRMQKTRRVQWIGRPLVRFSKGGMTTSGRYAWQSMRELNDIYERHDLARVNVGYSMMMLRLVWYRARYAFARLRVQRLWTAARNRV